MTESSDARDRAPKPMVDSAPASSAEFPFDAVVVADGDVHRNLTPAEFFALPLAERIKCVVQQKASFYVKGESVDAREILSRIRKMRTTLH
jgi:hypothetical protein